MGLPTEAWDLYTDYPREHVTGPPRVASVPVKTAASVELQDALTAFVAALAVCDHGREALWLFDGVDAARPRPLKAELQLGENGQGSSGTLGGLRRELEAQRAAAASAEDAQDGPCSGSALSAALQDQEKRFAGRRAHPVCQAAVSRQPLRCVAGEWPLDFVLVAADETTLDYRSDLYEEGTATFLARHVAALLNLREAWDSMKLSDMATSMVDREEQKLLVHTWNNTAAAFEEKLGVHQLFERCARGRLADEVALLPADADDAPWTYRQLDTAAGQVAAALLALGLPETGRVPILMPRCCSLLAGIYGVLRAGMAYVALDPEWPAERRDVIVEDVEASALLAGPALASSVAKQLSLPVLELRELKFAPGKPRLEVTAVGGHNGNGCTGNASSVQPAESAASELDPKQSVYILYTSGTTGKPKGVDVPHLGLVGRTGWLQHTWPLTEGSVVAQKTPFTFAISEWELFWPLCYGAKLALAADGLHGDSQHVATLFKTRKVTHSVFVPSLLDHLLDELEGEDLPHLELIIACGEALKEVAARHCLRALPRTELVNLYGPTEGTMTMLRIPREPSPKDLYRFPVGVPMENTLIYCAAGPEPGFAPAPVLAKGEMLFGGPLIATGYWRLPELTRSKFVPNPHGPGRVYRTGDLGRWRADGTLEFLGRVDNQVKFNGVRIELGEIESAAGSIDDVKSAVAFLHPPHLVVVCTLKTRGTGEAEVQRLQSELRRTLPKDRVPTRVEILDAVPTTERGKVDRKKLAEEFQQREAKRAADLKAKGEGATGAGPETATERTIDAAVREVLGVEGKLPVTAKFQEIGFSSLLLGKLTARVRRTCSLPGLPATAVYRHQSVRDLATHVDEEKKREMENSYGEEASLTPFRPAWRGGSPTSPLSLLCTCVGMLCQAIVCEFAFLPAYYILWEIYLDFGMMILCVSVAPVLMLDTVITVLIHVGLKWIILGKRREGNYPIFGWEYWKWWFVHTMEHYIEGHVSSTFTDTPLYNVFLRLQGASIGRDVRVNHCHVSDADLITIGPDSRVEREATLSPARLWCGELQLRRIHVGSGSYVAHRSYLPGGTSLGNGMKLSPMASTDEHGPFHVTPLTEPVQKPTRKLALLQLLLGVPILMLIESASELPALYAMSWMWNWLAGRGTSSRGVVKRKLSSTDVIYGQHTGKGRQMQGKGRGGRLKRVLGSFMNFIGVKSTDGVEAGLAGKGRGERRLRIPAKDHHYRHGRSLNATQPPTMNRGGHQWGWALMKAKGYTLEDKHRLLYPFIASIPWIMTFVHGSAYFFLVVLLKRCVIGRFQAGPIRGDWDVFRRWLLERFVTSATFNEFMELFVNTEFLACCYRLLGANIGPRVNMDFFGCVEYDLLEIERDVVFGSSALLVNTEHGVSKSVTLRKNACILDHSCVMPGSVVPEGALLGSFTVLPQTQKLEAMNVYTGCEKGQCVRLFQRPLLPGERIEGERVVKVAPENGQAPTSLSSEAPALLAPTAIKQRHLEHLAMRRHTSDFWFWLFNFWCLLAAVLFAPLPDTVYWATIAIDFEVYDFFRDSEMGEVISIMLIPPIYVGVNVLMLAIIASLKWFLIGKWTVGDRPYYTWFHFRWAALMVAFASFDDLLSMISGTWFSVLFMRAMGAKVGKKVCFFGHGFEYDLLNIGDNVCIGPDCDVTAHTVENMVMKMEVVKFGEGSSILGGSVVMPGGQMEPWSTLIEHSQVLKGEVVPQGEFFGGLPAKLLRRYPHPSSDFQVRVANTANGNDAVAGQPLLGNSTRAPKTLSQGHVELTSPPLAPSRVAYQDSDSSADFSLVQTDDEDAVDTSMSATGLAGILT
eukprot:TRINITY_DN9903_c0_g1_i7.p1 TRINITY_DN9903_c0_g1~~TRINITY_DN9903_c0_g1_i7.p1  ORF type:complete len:1824 (+),score=356.55 TRINITY_DN9903_c0_g1_i7:65-5536(+)